MLDEAGFRNSLVACFPLLELDLSGLEQDQDGVDEVGRLMESEDVDRLQPVLLGPGCDSEDDIARWLRHAEEVYVLNVSGATVERYVLMDGDPAYADEVRLQGGGVRLLPMFGIFVCRCAAFNSDGFVYSPNAGLKRFYDGLWACGKITGGTKRVIVADSSQEVAQGDPRQCFMRAHVLVSDGGVTEFGWTPDRNLRVSAGSGGRSRKRKAPLRRNRS